MRKISSSVGSVQSFLHSFVKAWRRTTSNEWGHTINLKLLGLRVIIPHQLDGVTKCKFIGVETVLDRPSLPIAAQYYQPIHGLNYIGQAI